MEFVKYLFLIIKTMIFNKKGAGGIDIVSVESTRKKKRKTVSF